MTITSSRPATPDSYVPSRRTVLRAAAWTAPAVSVAVAVPAYAAASSPVACADATTTSDGLDYNVQSRTAVAGLSSGAGAGTVGGATADGARVEPLLQQHGGGEHGDDRRRPTCVGLGQHVRGLASTTPAVLTARPRAPVRCSPSTSTGQVTACRSRSRTSTARTRWTGGYQVSLSRSRAPADAPPASAVPAPTTTPGGSVRGTTLWAPRSGCRQRRRHLHRPGQQSSSLERSGPRRPAAPSASS